MKKKIAQAPMHCVDVKLGKGAFMETLEMHASYPIS